MALATSRHLLISPSQSEPVLDAFFIRHSKAPPKRTAEDDFNLPRRYCPMDYMVEFPRDKSPVLSLTADETHWNTLLVSPSCPAFELQRSATASNLKYVIPPITKKFEALISNPSFNRTGIPDLNVVLFNKAVLSFLAVFDAFGGVFFADLIKSDIQNNLYKSLRSCKKFKAITLQKMVKEEILNHSAGRDSGTEALMWLKRTLKFVSLLIHHLVEGDRHELKDIAVEAYGAAMKKYHNWMLQQIFYGALHLLPPRKDFFTHLGGAEELIIKQLAEFLQVFNQCVNAIDNFYHAYKFEESGF